MDQKYRDFFIFFATTQDNRSIGDTNSINSMCN